MPHRVVWFDVPARDLQRAIKFYAAVLACKVSQDSHDMKVGVIEHSGSDVSGCIVEHESEQPSPNGPLLYFSVSGRLDVAIAAVEAHGGKILKPSTRSARTATARSCSIVKAIASHYTRSNDHDRLETEGQEEIAPDIAL